MKTILIDRTDIVPLSEMKCHRLYLYHDNEPFCAGTFNTRGDAEYARDLLLGWNEKGIFTPFNPKT